MTDQEREELDQALDQLKRRSYELCERDFAQAWELRRMIDDLNARMIERFTTPQKEQTRCH